MSLLGEGRRLFGLDLPGQLGSQARFVALEGQGLSSQPSFFGPHGSSTGFRPLEKGAGAVYGAADAWGDLPFLLVGVGEPLRQQVGLCCRLAHRAGGAALSGGGV